MAFFTRRFTGVFSILIIILSTGVWSSDHEILEEDVLEEQQIEKPQSQKEPEIDIIQLKPESGFIQNAVDELVGEVRIEDGPEFDLKEKKHEVIIQIDSEFDLEKELLKDAEESVLRSHRTDRKWYYTLRNAYALTGEILVVSSTVLDVVTVISAGVGATLYGDNEAGRACIIVAGIAEVCSIAFAKTGNHTKEASRRYGRYLIDLNNQDMGLDREEREEREERDIEEGYE